MVRMHETDMDFWAELVTMTGNRLVLEDITIEDTKFLYIPNNADSYYRVACMVADLVSVVHKNGLITDFMFVKLHQNYTIHNIACTILDLTDVPLSGRILHVESIISMISNEISLKCAFTDMKSRDGFVKNVCIMLGNCYYLLSPEN